MLETLSHNQNKLIFLNETRLNFRRAVTTTKSSPLAVRPTTAFLFNHDGRLEFLLLSVLEKSLKVRTFWTIIIVRIDKLTF
jgi:hypothetical protein